VRKVSSRFGRSANCAPVRRIRRMLFNTSQLLRYGYPRLSKRRGASPISGSSAAHYSTALSMMAASSRWTQQRPIHVGDGLI
jgi:hypothetical protein